MTVEELKVQKAKNLRWKKPIVRNLNYEYIYEELTNMSLECDEIKYYIDTSDEDNLLSALCGDEDEAAEFKIAFSDLSAECDRMFNDIQEEYISEYFDAVFVAVEAGEYEGGVFGWDVYECDYFGLDTWDTSAAQKASREKLKRLTKNKLLDTVRSSMKILYAYLGLKDRYTNLKAAIDILRGQNTEQLNLVKQIEASYEKVTDKFCSWQDENNFERLINSLMEEAWLW